MVHTTITEIAGVCMILILRKDTLVLSAQEVDKMYYLKQYHKSPEKMEQTVQL